MGEDINKRYIEPIVNASRPGTLAALSMSILKFSTEDPLILQITLIVGAILFLLSSFFIFFFFYGFNMFDLSVHHVIDVYSINNFFSFEMLFKRFSLFFVRIFHSKTNELYIVIV